MCGFLIEYRKKNIKFDKDFFLSNAKKINHRGPDDEGDIYLKYFSAKFYRLSILDLRKQANQPMKSQSGRFTILFNGEIYNFLEIKKKFNFITKTNSDTEIVLKLFEKFGLKMVKILEGMFSIVIYDQEKNICYFFRDRFGIKPLYFFESEEKIVFSSEIKPLLNYSVKKVNSKKMLDFFLKQSMDDDIFTLFENIYSIQPGYCGQVSQNKMKQERYWEFETTNNSNFNLKQEKSNIESLFSSSVKKHLISDREVGFFFSGGTDSLSILSKAKKFLKNPKLFTYNFLSNDGKFYGEYEKAKQISSNLKLNLDITTVTPKMITENFDKVIDVCESPITSIRQICDFLLFKRFKKLNIPVAIIGHGGDELLGGYDYNFLNFLIDKYKGNLNCNKFLNDLISYIDLKGKKDKDKKVKLMNHIITLSYQFGSTKDCTPFIEIENFSKDLLDEYIDEKFYAEKKIPKYNYLQNSQMRDIQHVSLPRNLKCCDRLSMSNGIEARVPFLDHKLANYLFNLDNKYKFKENQTRWIFKSLFNKEISKYFSKKKNSVPDPQSLWLKNDLKEFFMDEFKSKKFQDSKFFNSKKINKSLEKFSKNETRSSFHLFQIFTFQKFLNHFKI